MINASGFCHAEDHESDDDDDVNSEGGFDGTLDKLSDLSEGDKRILFSVFFG